MRKKMMKMAGSALLLALVTGCPYTYLASPETDPKTAEWEAFIRESYPDYTPPPRRAKSIAQPEALPAAVEAEESAVSSDLPAPEQLPAETEAETEKNNTAPEIPASAEKAEKTAHDTANAEEKTAKDAVTEVKPDAEEAEAKESAETAEVKSDAEKPAEKTVVPDADPNTPPDPTNSTVYEVKSGDTLGAIAQKMYGNASFSNVIHKANMDILKDPDKLKVGMKLIIPKL